MYGINIATVLSQLVHQVFPAYINQNRAGENKLNGKEQDTRQHIEEVSAEEWRMCGVILKCSSCKKKLHWVLTNHENDRCIIVLSH